MYGSRALSHCRHGHCGNHGRRRAAHSPCSRCHTSPTGGKDLTDFGKEFKANGNQMKK
jgi:hypothetical protein